MKTVTPTPENSATALVRENKLELLERLADDLAHEIKNPLHSLVINLEVLKRRIARTADAEQTSDMLRYVGVIDGELARVHRRVELLLRLVRPGRRSDDVPVNEIADDLVELVELEGGRRKVTVRYEPGAGTTAARLPVDQGRQALLNLILSVLDRLPAGSTLALQTRAEPGAALLLVSGELADRASPVTGADDPRVGAARSLCAHMGATLVPEGADETPAPALGIRVPFAKR